MVNYKISISVCCLLFTPFPASLTRSRLSSVLELPPIWCWPGSELSFPEDSSLQYRSEMVHIIGRFSLWLLVGMAESPSTPFGDEGRGRKSTAGEDQETACLPAIHLLFCCLLRYFAFRLPGWRVTSRRCSLPFARRLAAEHPSLSADLGITC